MDCFSRKNPRPSPGLGEDPRPSAVRQREVWPACIGPHLTGYSPLRSLSASYRCYSAQSAGCRRPRGARENMVNPVTTGKCSSPWAAGRRRVAQRTKLAQLADLRNSALKPKEFSGVSRSILGSVVLAALRENGARRERATERTTHRRRGPGRGWTRPTVAKKALVAA